MPGQKRIPTILALAVLLFGVASGVFVIQTNPFRRLLAKPEFKPQQVEVSNITDSSVTISWITQNPATGVIEYSLNDEPKQIAKDKRDVSASNLGSYFTHWVQIAGLEPGQTYQFAIQSQAVKYSDQHRPFTFTTSNYTSAVPSPGLTLSLPSASGSVVLPDGQPASGVIVYLQSSNLSLQSALTNTQGIWVINLVTARTQDLSRTISLPDLEDMPVQLSVTSGNQRASSAQLLGSQLTSVPQITIGQTYDFTILVEQESGVIPQSKFSLIPPKQGSSPAETSEITIWNPQENEYLATDYPEFIGTAPASTTINITIESTQSITGQALTNEKGNWRWTPPTSLTPGDHKITISHTDAQGILFEITRKFTILAANQELPAIEASPSATIAPTSSPAPSSTPIPSPTPTTAEIPVPTATPTIAEIPVSPTPTTMPLPTMTPTPTPVPTFTPTTAPATPTPTPAVPVSGFSLPTISLAGIGILIFGLGVVLLL